MWDNNWGSRHRDYYDGQDGTNNDPRAIENNYWQQGDDDSSSRNVTVSGNHLIARLNEVPQTIISAAGLDRSGSSRSSSASRSSCQATLPGRRCASLPRLGMALLWSRSALPSIPAIRRSCLTQ